MTSYSFTLTFDHVQIFRNLISLLSELTVDIDFFVHRKGLAIEYAYIDQSNAISSFVVQSFWPVHAFADFSIGMPDPNGRIVIRVNTQLMLSMLKGRSSIRCDRVILAHDSGTRELRMTLSGRAETRCAVPISNSAFQIEKDCAPTTGVIPPNVLGPGAGCSIRNYRSELCQFLENITRDNFKPTVEIYARSSHASRLHIQLKSRPEDALMQQELFLNPIDSSLPPIGIFNGQLLLKILAECPSEFVSLHYDRNDARLDFYIGLGSPNAFLTVRIYGKAVPVTAAQKLEAECLGIQPSVTSFLSTL